jgi:hypothetical protein
VTLVVYVPVGACESENDTFPSDPVVPDADQLWPRVVLESVTATVAPLTGWPLALSTVTVFESVLPVALYVIEATCTLTVVVGGGFGWVGGVGPAHVTWKLEVLPESVNPPGVAVAFPSSMVIASCCHEGESIGPVTPLIVADAFVNPTVLKSTSGNVPWYEDGASWIHSADVRCARELDCVVE